MKGAQRPDHMSLIQLLDDLKKGCFVIPDFQREFEWQPWDVKDLIRSIFLDYYIGSLLLWKGKKDNYKALSCEILYGYNDEQTHHSWEYERGRPQHIVLDGQQRLTALYYALVAPNVPLPNRKSRAMYFLHVDKFMEEQYDDAFQYDWLSRRFSNIIENPERQYSDHIFPLSIIGGKRFQLSNWQQGYEKFWEKEVKNAEQIGDYEQISTAKNCFQNAVLFNNIVQDIVTNYQIAYIELDEDLGVDKVCDIFTQINSKGVRLDIFDLINALLRPKDIQLKLLWRKAAPRLSFVSTGKMNVYVLQVMSILVQSYCSPKYLYYLLPGQEKKIRSPSGELESTILVPTIMDFQNRWEIAVTALENALNMLKHPQEFGVSSSQFLPYVTILPIFAALQHSCNDLPHMKRLDAQRKIRHWYWASVFLNRYSGSVDSTSARDFLDLKAWFEDEELQPGMIQEFRDRFRRLDLRKEVKKGTSVYNGIFNLFLIQGARDWLTGNIPQHGDLDDHHIVPASWEGAKHLKNESIHTILNRAPLTSDTNRNFIRNRLPNQYLPEMIAHSSKEQVMSILKSHFITEKAFNILTRSPFGLDDYEEFISERQHTIVEAIENLLIKERIDLTPPLRELDRSIEEVELSIRRAIVMILGNDIEKVPQHVSVKLNERIMKAAKKNATIDLENFKQLSERIEFADLRELQEMITSRMSWELFQPRFVNKEALNIKFDQLAELRNGIRHSRSVTEITRMEGEAAIKWFGEVLNK